MAAAKSRQRKRLEDERVEREKKWRAQTEKNAIKKAERQEVERAKKARRLHRKAVRDGHSTDSGPELTASKAVDALTGLDMFHEKFRELAKGKRPVKAAAGTKTPAPAKQASQPKGASSVAATAGTSTKGRIATPKLLSDSPASEAEDEESESESESSESGASESTESESELITEVHYGDVTTDAEKPEPPLTERAFVEWNASPLASPLQEIEKPSNDVINQSEEAVSQSLEEDDTALGRVENEVPLDYGTEDSPAVSVSPTRKADTSRSPTRGLDTSTPQPTPTRAADTSRPQPTPTSGPDTSRPQPTPTRGPDTSRPQPTPTRGTDTSRPQLTPTREADASRPQPTPSQGKKSSLSMAASPSQDERTPRSKRERVDIPPERSSERKRLKRSKASVEPSTPADLQPPPEIRGTRSSIRTRGSRRK